MRVTLVSTLVPGTTMVLKKYFEMSHFLPTSLAIPSQSPIVPEPLVGVLQNSGFGTFIYTHALGDLVQSCDFNISRSLQIPQYLSPARPVPVYAITHLKSPLGCLVYFKLMPRTGHLMCPHFKPAPLEVFPISAKGN